MMPQKTNGGTQLRLPDEHIHTLLGYNVASAQPSSAAKPESNILRSPHVAQAWPRPQMEITHHCNSVQPSVCSLSVCLSVMSACLASNASVRISVYISVSTCLAAWLWIYPPVCMSALYSSPVYLSLSVCLQMSHPGCIHSVRLSSAFLPVCLLVCVSVPAPVIKRSICSGSSRQQH